MEALLLPVLLIAVFYFLLIRPQQRQRRQMTEIQQSLAVGSKVMTGAGLLATVVAVDDEKDEVLLEVAPGVTNRYVRRAIVNVLEGPGVEDDFEESAADDEPFSESGDDETCIVDDADTASGGERAEDADTAVGKDEMRNGNRANDGESR